MSPLHPLLFWLPFLGLCGLVYGGVWVFRVISRGWTQVHAERAICFRDRWGRLPERNLP